MHVPLFSIIRHVDLHTQKTQARHVLDMHRYWQLSPPLHVV